MSTAALSRRDIQRQLASVAIYIPVEGSRVDRMVDACSGLVGYLDAHTGYIVCYMEGNRLGASNMTRYAERIKHAAGRLFESYPTIAMFQIPASDAPANLIEVGSISRSYKVDFTRPGLALAYGASNGSSIRTADGRQYVKSESGAWTDGDHTVTRFQEPEGTFAVAENAPTRY